MSGPHSDFVKGVLSELELAAEFFALTLRPEVLERIDLNTLRLEDGSFVDDHNRAYYSDLLFTVDRRRGGTARFFLLFEHKSHPDESVLDQLALYQALIYRKQGRGRKSPVIPLVFYHGEEVWDVPLEYRDKIDYRGDDYEHFGRRLLNFEYTLVNVKNTRIDELKASVQQKAFWWTLAGIWDLKSREKLRVFLERVAEYFGKLPDDFLWKVVAYILRAQDIERAVFEKAMAAAITASKARTVMGTLDKIEEKARLEGKLEGKLEGARVLINEGVPLDVVLKTGVSLEQLKKAGII